MHVPAHLIDELISKLKPYSCPLCNDGQWIVTSEIFYLNEYFKDKVVVGAKSFPVLPIVCNKCGNTMFINALVANLIEDKPSKEVKKDEKSNTLDR